MSEHDDSNLQDDAWSWPPVDSTGVQLAEVELDWGPVFAADLTGKAAS